MADFCKQCSEEMFGQYAGDLTFDGTEGATMHCLCEGCGFNCIVTPDGTCISETCLKQHGKQAGQADDIAMQEQEIAADIAIQEQERELQQAFYRDFLRSSYD